MSRVSDEELREAMRVGAGEARGVPEGFADRVMAAVEARSGGAGAGTIGADEAPGAGDAADPSPALWDRLVRPRTLTWRPIQALAAALALAVAGTLLFALGGGSEGGPSADGHSASGDEPVRVADAGEAAAAATGDTVLVRFVYEAPSAASVAVAGDFTRWNPVPLERRVRNGRLLWTGVVAVPRGEHEYMFVVDGEEWVTDPLAPAVTEDGFGNRNAVLSL